MTLKIFAYAISGAALGACGALGLATSSLTESAQVTVGDFLRIALLGACLAAGGPLVEWRWRKLIHLAIAGAFTLQLLVLLGMRLVETYTSPTVALAGLLGAAGIFPATIAFIDTLADEATESRAYVMLVATVGGMLGLALGLLASSFFPSSRASGGLLLFAGFYGSSIWTAIAIAKAGAESRQ